jgi:LSD1 subclass zinc finger protein
MPIVVDENLRQLIEEIKVSVRKYLDTQPDDARLHVNLFRDSIAKGQEDIPIVMCPGCYTLNRLPHGADRAVCGKCKTPLPRMTEVAPSPKSN